MSGREFDFVMPVWNEAENIEAAFAEIDLRVRTPHRIVVVFDLDSDNTLPVIERIGRKDVVTVKNSGRGVLEALKTGIAVADADVVVVTMADLSDDLRVVDEMVRLIREGGADVVCPSRYMPGGRQIGGPLLKRTLARLAGLSLHRLRGFPVRDVTNSFRAYRRSLFDVIAIESQAGFSLAMEVTVKAWLGGATVREVPTLWRDRSHGGSRFRLWRWLPQYLRWYCVALVRRPAPARAAIFRK